MRISRLMLAGGAVGATLAPGQLEDGTPIVAGLRYFAVLLGLSWLGARLDLRRGGLGLLGGGFAGATASGLIVLSRIAGGGMTSDRWDLPGSAPVLAGALVFGAAFGFLVGTVTSTFAPGPRSERAG